MVGFNEKAKTVNALVIGATGFIGSNLVRYLIRNDYNVRIYRRSSSSLKNLSGLNYDDMIGDILDEGSLTKAIEGCQAVFNLAACTSSLKKDNELGTLINVKAVGTIARAVRKNGHARLVHVSSIAAVGAPRRRETADEDFCFNKKIDIYAYTKYLGEQDVLKEVLLGLDAVIACPGNVVGCRGMKEIQLSTFKNIAAGKMNIYPGGGVCLTDVDDLVRGLVLCFKKGVRGKRYILGGNNVSYKRYLDEIALATGGRGPKIRLPRPMLLFMGMAAEVVFGLMGKDPFISRDTADVISSNLFYSSNLAIKELGYTITDFSETIRKAAEVLKGLNE